MNTYSGHVAKDHFPGAELVSVPLFGEVFLHVDADPRHVGVVPLENIHTGEIRENLDLLWKAERARIIDETSLKIVHCLGAMHGHGEIKTIWTKDEVFAQCRPYLNEHYLEAQKIPSNSTDEATAMVAKTSNLGWAAIASQNALQKAGLEVLAVDLRPDNITRFAIIGQGIAEKTGRDKTFIAVEPSGNSKDESGVMYRISGAFAKRSVNMEFLTTRPNGRRGYVFYIEINGHQQDQSLSQALSEIVEMGYKTKILGSYKDSRWKETS